MAVFGKEVVRKSRIVIVGPPLSGETNLIMKLFGNAIDREISIVTRPPYQ